MLPLFAGTTGRDSKRHQPLPVVARRLCPYHSCRVPFVRSTPRASSSQKVPDTFLSHDPYSNRIAIPASSAPQGAPVRALARFGFQGFPPLIRFCQLLLQLAQLGLVFRLKFSRFL